MSPSDWSSLRLGVDVQVEWQTADDGYVADRRWRGAILDECPFHPEGGCGVRGHGSYPRVSPEGARIPRFWCPREEASISLLPSFLASRVMGTLDEIETAVLAVERDVTFASAVEAVRPAEADDAVSLPAAERWLRRRMRWVRRTLVSLVTLLPELAGAAPTLSGVREHLGVDGALVALRRLAGRHLWVVAAPVGLVPRARR